MGERGSERKEQVILFSAAHFVAWPEHNAFNGEVPNNILKCLVLPGIIGLFCLKLCLSTECLSSL